MEAYHGKPRAGSGTGVSGLFRCGGTPGGWVCLPVLCLHAARRCRVGVPPLLLSSLSHGESFLVSPCVVSRAERRIGLKLKYRSWRDQNVQGCCVFFSFLEILLICVQWCSILAPSPTARRSRVQSPAKPGTFLYGVR